ncbi:DUF4168 domain-containing protein [Anabaena azotica]|uniref:DUF4168 domain-containing protein n=1 Tax=Anabaena azotica FACHB-119 TaxID=947527 RepID=A0ABR8D499_9NOST|nr:DUF4168 domain-containing protein [Anabaena azotica]MBD2502015.1 DUF4168 domain-containing protein [Anabaena azotica FACHB-119]
MKIIPHTFFPTSMQKLLAKTLLFGISTSASLLVSTGSLKANAQNQSFNSTEITSYAQAVLAMEPARQEAFGQIKKIIGGGDVPQIVCSEPSSMNSLPSKARNIAVNYCNHSQRIVGDYGLTIDKFNRMTTEIQNNSNLKQQVYNTLIRIQKNTNSQ